MQVRIEGAMGALSHRYDASVPEAALAALAALAAFVRRTSGAALASRPRIALADGGDQPGGTIGRPGGIGMRDGSRAGTIGIGCGPSSDTSDTDDG
jgi:hypothetical protein